MTIIEWTSNDVSTTRSLFRGREARFRPWYRMDYKIQDENSSFFQCWIRIGALAQTSKLQYRQVQVALPEV